MTIQLSISFALIPFFLSLNTLKTPQQGDQVDHIEELALDIGCFECHDNKEDHIGPSFFRIAHENEHTDDAKSYLASTIREGSKGRYMKISHGVPMPRYYKLLTEQEINQMVDWILRKKNE